MKLIEKIRGEDFDFQDLGLKDLEQIIPVTQDFMLYKYLNTRTNRIMQFKKCTYPGCNKRPFTKWHNFLDHLRKHTGQRPF